MRTLPLLLAGAALVLLSGNACADPKDPPVKQAAKENRLGKERSPYLRQHKFNPVDWYPWGEEAFERARKEDKPIFLSVGYAACHWCHVMEHESFEDEETARLLNEAFVCVKVDREERPDLDRVYMTAVQVASQGRGGWPMTVIMTPDEKPFFARTYLSKEQVQQVTQQISRLWQEDRKQLQGYADSLADAVARSVGAGDLPDTDDSDAEIFQVLANRLANTFDRHHGGFGDRPKFPPHAELLYHLHAGGERMDADERAMVFTTLDAMARGGIHDQVGGGFHRYSTDARWLLPHFEKMLYDNALLAQAFSRAYALEKKPRYRRVVERLFGWLEREMARPSGGYASSLDADTEGEEGITYTWTRAQLRAALPAADADLIEAVFDVQERGNFREEATGHHTGHNNLHWTASLQDLAKARSVQPEALRTRIDGLLDKLLAVRNGRAQPGLDDKVITGWNGLLLSAFARAGTDLGDPALHERGRALASYLLSASRRADGTLLRFPKDSGPEIPAFCEDYVHMINGLLDLAAATGESRWSDAAGDLAKRLNDEFEDIEGGGFFATSALQHEQLIARAKETFDSPIPSDNGVAARVNLRLHALTGDPGQRKAADRTLALFRSHMATPRMSSGVVALTDALRLRGELDAVAGTAPVRGDVHARRGVVQADLFLSRTQAALGGRVEVLVRVHVEAGWHVNAHRPGGAGLIGTSLSAAEGAPAGLADLRYPKPASRRLGSEAEAPVDLYEGTFDIRATLTVPKDVPAGPRKIPLVLRVQPCDDRSCLDALTLELPVALRFAETDGSVTHPTLFPDAK